MSSAIRFDFPITNNQAEYEALIAGLRAARAAGAKSIKVLTDSQLVVGHIQGSYEARDDNMKKYLQKVKELTPSFLSCEVRQVPRSENVKADMLSRLASLLPPELERETYFEVLKSPSIEEPPPIMQVEEEPCWIDPILNFLKTGDLPPNQKQARKVKHQAAHYVLYDDKLYKRSFIWPLLKCLRPSEADYAMREVHEGACGNHLGGRSLSYKILRQGYYWPTMQLDSQAFVRKCDRCQRNANIQRQPSARLVPLSSPWPFAQWGMDILGPFPQASGRRKFLLVAIDYFTKWVEAESLANISEGKIVEFVWKSIICRYGLPRTIITDNGRQFSGAQLRDLCKEHMIEQRFTSVAHPQSNGEAEVTNRTLLQGIKARLERSRGTWADELQHVLWAYRTTQRVPTGETPFNLAFGTEAVIPLELGLPSLRVEEFDEDTNSTWLRANLDLVEESRERAAIKMASYRQRVAKYYNARVKPKEFRAGDLVLRRAEVSQPTERGKLALNWEGPYSVEEVIRPGTYRLKDLDGATLPRPWNSANLRIYHP